MKISALTLTLALALAPPAPAVPPALTAETVRQAVEMTAAAWQLEQATDPPYRRRLACGAASERFAALLDALATITAASAADSPAEGESLAGKIVAIAAERARHPERFAEIRRTYVAAQPRPWRTQAAPLPAPQHATEGFRLAWEEILLAPCPANPSPGYRSSAAAAVAAIGNPASLLTLRHLARLSAQGPADDAALARQRLLIRTLAGMPAASSAGTLVEVVELAEPTGTARREAGAGRAWDARAYAAGAIGERPRTRIEAWRQALASLASPARRGTGSRTAAALLTDLKRGRRAP